MWCLIVFRYSWYSAIFVLAVWIYEHKMGILGVTIFALEYTAKISQFWIRCINEKSNQSIVDMDHVPSVKYAANSWSRMTLPMPMTLVKCTSIEDVFYFQDIYCQIFAPKSWQTYSHKVCRVCLSVTNKFAEKVRKSRR